MDKVDLVNLEVYLYKSGYTTTEVGKIVDVKTSKVSNDLKKELVEMRSASESRKKKKVHPSDFTYDIQTMLNLYNIKKEDILNYYVKNPAPRKPINFAKKEESGATVVELKELIDSLINNILNHTTLYTYDVKKKTVYLKAKIDGKFVLISEGNEESYQEVLKKMALGQLKDVVVEYEEVYDNEDEDIDFLNSLFTYIKKLNKYVATKFDSLDSDISLHRRKKTHTFSIKISIQNKTKKIDG